VVFVPELPKTCAWGATRWVSQSHAVMQLSLRYNTDDHLGFTFFHEAGHILLHGKRDVFVETDEETQTQEEREADEFAREFLIPQREHAKFCRRRSFSCAAISRFAYELGIANGIVVGRLQHDKLLPRTNCNDLKRHFTWTNEESR
jgi:HTH-type transcriptional regulator/antitoxin HigA